MNKKDIMKYYIKDWIPHMDNFFWFFSKKSKIINYNGSKILLKLDQACSNWSLELIPKTKNNILTDNFNLLVWIRYENYSNINENPVGLKKIMNKELFSKKINCLAETTSILIRAVCDIQIKLNSINKKRI